MRRVEGALMIRYIYMPVTRVKGVQMLEYLGLSHDRVSGLFPLANAFCHFYIIEHANEKIGTSNVEIRMVYLEHPGVCDEVVVPRTAVETEWDAIE